MAQERVVLRRSLGYSGPTIWLLDTENSGELVIPKAKWWLPRGSEGCRIDEIERVSASVIVPHTIWGFGVAVNLWIIVAGAAIWSLWCSFLILPALIAIWALENGTLVLTIQRRGVEAVLKYRLCRSAEDRLKALRAAVEEINHYLNEKRQPPRGVERPTARIIPFSSSA